MVSRISAAITAKPLNSRLANYIVTFFGSSLALVYAYNASNTSGHTKKVTVNALNMMGYCVGFLLGPQLFRDPPYYHKAKVAVVAIWIVATLCIAGLGLVNWLAN